MAKNQMYVTTTPELVEQLEKLEVIYTELHGCNTLSKSQIIAIAVSKLLASFNKK